MKPGNLHNMQGANSCRTMFLIDERRIIEMMTTFLVKGSLFLSAHICTLKR